MDNAVTRFQQYRKVLHSHLPYRADAILNLLDSLSGRQSAQSVAEVSLEIPFERRYSSLYDAIDNFPGGSRRERLTKGLERVRILEPMLPRPERHPFWLIGVDGTPAPRVFSKTLADRSIVYSPNPAPGNKPIVVGHSYSVTALLPERERGSPPWVVPLLCTRIPTDKTAKEVAVEQIGELLSDKELPFHGDLTVHVADSGYGNARYLSPSGAYRNGVGVVRIAANRNLYRDISGTVMHPGGGRQKCFGEKFSLNDEGTWWEPDEEVELDIITNKGKRLRVKLQRWNDLLMRGKRDAPMHNRPFDLIRCQVFNEDGTLAFKNTLWLVVLGERRKEVLTRHAYGAYRQRYDLEHFFRFGKNRLLLDRNQTCEVKHEENWWELSCLAYTQLWLAASLSEKIPRPWEKHKPEFNNHTIAGPAQVQRDFQRIIRAFGTPAVSPKPRGNSPGRKKGDAPGRRIPRNVVYKSRSPPKKAA